MWLYISVERMWWTLLFQVRNTYPASKETSLKRVQKHRQHFDSWFSELHSSTLNILHQKNSRLQTLLGHRHNEVFSQQWEYSGRHFTHCSSGRDPSLLISSCCQSKHWTYKRWNIHFTSQSRIVSPVPLCKQKKYNSFILFGNHHWNCAVSRERSELWKGSNHSKKHKLLDLARCKKNSKSEWTNLVQSTKWLSLACK